MSSVDQLPTLEEIKDEFEFLGNWEDRCEYLIDAGFDLPEFPDELKTETNRVHGCQSLVWMVANKNKANTPPTIDIQAVSDAMIVKGLIVVLLAIYSGKTPEEILRTDPREIFAELELEQHLSSARKNGLSGMVKRVQEYALAVASEEND